MAHQIGHRPPWAAGDIRAEIRACRHVAEPPEISLKAISQSLALHAASVAHTPDNPRAAGRGRPGAARGERYGGHVTGTDVIVERILTTYDTITVVGASGAPAKAAHYVPAHMQQHGWRIIPVNPHADAILGEPVYRTLREVPGQIGLVNVFRPSRQTPDFARQAVAAGATALWLQLGIASPEARAIAEEAGLHYVEDRCLIIERRRLQLRAPGTRH
jgi:predicted CoA-binding protein